MGLHGRKRAGPGEDFWQYRHAMPGDVLDQVDWRRSARSDGLFIREKEWQAAQTVALWVDPSRAMDYRSADAPRSKAERARLIALALAILLNRSGERVSLLGVDPPLPPRSGPAQLSRMAMALTAQDDDRPDYGRPPDGPMPRGGRAVFLSDFMGARDELFAGLASAAQRGVSGCFVQILDESEETFPFDGRTVFRSVGGSVRFETQRARALRDAYQARLAQRRAELQDVARRTGWQCLFHRTSESPRKALLWLYMALGGQD
ncbi:DUF58 domain-containing protein [Rhodobacteraceae bacterium KN286]|uniref:DUF58 domain-containing protein n=2 Tax=Oceanomicrobium pacificus TaxID=2692916 RepID=A0A6B0U1J3_9RHOB|nr:DUF58 domain-containing protein [Oceanomicrobium pacificus]